MISKDRLFVQYIDDFLAPEELSELQKLSSKLKYKPMRHKNGLYAFGADFSIEENEWVFAKIKQSFFPDKDLVPFHYGMRRTHNVEKPLPHYDYKFTNYNCLLFIKGSPLFNNGTGFFINDQLSSHVGFIENRAIFFNGSKILHSNLQSFGDSSPRYSLNIFYKEQEEN